MKHISILRILLSLAISLLCASTVISALPTKGEEQLYDRVIRLHVLANSDSVRDQTLKLRVRDAILLYLNTMDIPDNVSNAEKAYRAHLAELEDLAEQTLSEAGYALPCHVTLTQETYPARTYSSGSGTYTLPAGTYRSLRVMIGNAVGQNWWCVLFPPLCLSLAAETKQPEQEAIPAAVYEDACPTAEEELAAVGFTPYEISLISGDGSPKTVIKFRIVEWIRQLLKK